MPFEPGVIYQYCPSCGNVLVPCEIVELEGDRVGNVIWLLAIPAVLLQLFACPCGAQWGSMDVLGLMDEEG